MMKKKTEITRFGLPIFLVIFVGWLIAFPITGLLFGKDTDRTSIVNSLFTALAFGGLIITLIYQKQDLALQREELELTREELAKTAIANTLSARISAVVNLMNMPPLTEEEKAEMEEESKCHLSSRIKDELDKAVSECAERSAYRELGLRLDSRVEYLLELSRLQARLRQIDKTDDDEFELAILEKSEVWEDRINEAVDVLYGRMELKKAKDPYEVDFAIGAIKSWGKSIEKDSMEDVVSSISAILACRDGMLELAQRDRRKNPEEYDRKSNEAFAAAKKKYEDEKKRKSEEAEKRKDQIKQ